MDEDARFPDGAEREAFGYLTTTGRSSGLPREIEIWFALVPQERVVYVMSGGRDRSQWVKNLRHDPNARFRIRGKTLGVRARFVEGGPEDAAVRDLLTGKYERQPGELARWRRESLPVAFDLV